MNCKLQVKLRLRLQLRLRPCSETQCTFLIPDRLTPTRPACLPPGAVFSVCQFRLSHTSAVIKCHTVRAAVTWPRSAPHSLPLPLPLSCFLCFLPGLSVLLPACCCCYFDCLEGRREAGRQGRVDGAIAVGACLTRNGFRRARIAADQFDTASNSSSGNGSSSKKCKLLCRL